MSDNSPHTFICSLDVVLDFLGGERRLALQEPLLDRKPGTMSLSECEETRATCENAVLTQLSYLELQDPYENGVFATPEGRDFFMAFLQASDLRVKLRPVRNPDVVPYHDC